MKEKMEVEPLCLDDIEVEALEERLELAIAAAICDCNNNCNSNRNPK